MFNLAMQDEMDTGSLCPITALDPLGAGDSLSSFGMDESTTVGGEDADTVELRIMLNSSLVLTRKMQTN